MAGETGGLVPLGQTNVDSWVDQQGPGKLRKLFLFEKWVKFTHLRFIRGHRGPPESLAYHRGSIFSLKIHFL